MTKGQNKAEIIDVKAPLERDEDFLRSAVPEAAWQRCYVHFLRNALDHLPQGRR